MMDDRMLMIDGRIYVGLPSEIIDEVLRLREGVSSTNIGVFSSPMEKKVIRHAQKAAIVDMIKVEYVLANQLYPPFHGEMEALGTLQEEYDEASIEVRKLDKQYRKFQLMLREGDKAAIMHRLSKMDDAVRDAMLELIQVGAMVQKTMALVDSED
jgi:hypothetical protein